MYDDALRHENMRKMRFQTDPRCTIYIPVQLFSRLPFKENENKNASSSDEFWSDTLQHARPPNLRSGIWNLESGARLDLGPGPDTDTDPDPNPSPHPDYRLLIVYLSLYHL